MTVALPGVVLDAVELVRVTVPLVTPFATVHGVQAARDVLLVRVVGPDTEGWGECVAMNTPGYSAEYVDGAHDVTRRFLVPLLAAIRSEHGSGRIDSNRLEAGLAAVAGHPMAKAAVLTAVLDAQLRAAGVSLADHLGVIRRSVPAGVAVGLQPSLAATLEVVTRHVAEGYRRVKLKVVPGRDVAVVAAVRERFGDALALQVDANGAYDLGDPAHLAALAALDAFGLQCIEQPLAAADLLGHAALATQLATPLCLDESITSVRSCAVALELGACGVVNLKPGRVGGIGEAVRIHDLCHARGVPVWCGGMLETGLGRAVNVALAALPGFTLPGDLSASARYVERDLTEPFVLAADGTLAVPTGPGIGVTPLPAVLVERNATHERLPLIS